jgi:transcription elongation factor Elf1
MTESWETTGGDPLPDTGMADRNHTPEATTTDEVGERNESNIEHVDVLTLPPCTVEIEVEINEHNCQRCNTIHPATFRQLGVPIDHYKWWAQCPVTGEPIITASVEPNGKPQPVEPEDQHPEVGSDV